MTRVSLLSGLAALLVYLATLAPTITWRHHGADSGELAVAAAVLGVPHPPGYPTWTLLAWLFAQLPTGELAQRIGLLSALSAAGAVALLVWLAQRLWAGRRGVALAAVCASLTLAFQFTFWSQAILVEVYALHIFFVALICALILPPAANRPTRRRIAAFVFGLGLGNHLSLVCLAPLFLPNLPCPRRLTPHPWRQAMLTAAADLALPALAGLAVYLYLPFSASRQPPLVWGDPSTPLGFWQLVSAQLYRGALFGLTPAEMWVRLGDWSRGLAQPLLWPGLAFTGLGLATQPRRLILTTGATAFGCALYALGYATADAFVYLLPVFWLAALWQAAGVLALADFFARRSQPSWRRAARAAAWIGLAGLLPLALLWQNWAMVDLSHDSAARRFGQAALAAAAPQALLVSDGDEHTFALWYVQDGLGQRPDVIIVERTLWNYAWYRRRLAQRWPLLSAEAGPDISALIADQLDARPVYITDPSEDIALRYDLTPAGPVWQVGP